MGYTLSLLLLAIAVSLDSFSTGLAYGLRNMRIPVKSILIIGCCSALSLALAMIFGQFIQGFFAPEAANRLGGIIIIGIGCWVLFQFYSHNKEQQKKNYNEKLVLNWEIKSIGIVIHILKKPTRADLDGSGIISGVEALMLGAALSLDAFGVGVGAAMLGFSPAILAGIVALMGCLFLSVGLLTGRLFSHVSVIQKVAFLPGIILILIGILKM